jgi:hypothetical protein
MTDNNSNNNLQLLRVNHSAKMTEAFESMLSDESLCDVSICCSGKVIKAHRVILAACSVYFKQVLSSINGQTQYPIIFVNGIQLQDLESMLEFMYRGEVTIPQTQLPSLVKSAETLGVSGLCQLDPNAQKCLSQSEDENKSRTSSPSDSATQSRRGKKRRKLSQKPDNELSSDNETTLKKPEENGSESEELNCNETKLTEKLAKSKLRSWSQQIALKALNKGLEESQEISEAETPTDSETPRQQSTDEQQVIEDIDDKEHNKKHIPKDNWRHSRLRRPPLKFSEYTFTKAIQEIKPIPDKSENQKEIVETDEIKTTEARPPSPRLTRGRSRVHSSDEHKMPPNRDDSSDAGLPSTSHENLNSSIQLTPITRSRKQTHSPSDGKLKDNDSSSTQTEKSPVKSITSDDDNSQTRSKAQPKPQSKSFNRTNDRKSLIENKTIFLIQNFRNLCV